MARARREEDARAVPVKATVFRNRLLLMLVSGVMGIGHQKTHRVGRLYLGRDSNTASSGTIRVVCRMRSRLG